MNILIMFALLGQSWGGEPVLRKTPLTSNLSVNYVQIIANYEQSLKSKNLEIEQLKKENVDLRMKLVNNVNNNIRKYQLADRNGQIWEHTDWPYLWNFVQQRNMYLIR